LSKKKTGYGFKRQRPIGNFIADFVCQDLKIVIELDGESHNHPERYKKDKIKDEYLSDLGLMVIRITNDDVINNLEGVASYIDIIIRERVSVLNK
jgi:very-short-patch-repair endonuclease